MIRLTASGLARAEQCIGSVVLPGFEESSSYADTGRAVDQFVQTAKTKGKDRALREAPDDLRDYLDALTLERIPDGAEYQVAFALNAMTGEVRRIPDRTTGYPEGFGPEWIFGTSDIVGVRDACAVVWDLKWGSYTIGRDPADDLQLGFYAFCASRIASVDKCEVGLMRAGWDSQFRPESVTLADMALDAMADRIVGIWRRAQSSDPPRLHVGDWCGYCPARRGCPAQVQPVALALRGDLATLAGAALPPPELVREKVTALTLDEKGCLYERIDTAVDYLGMIRGILRDDAKTTPIPLSGNRELRLVMWGARKASPIAKAEENALEENLRARGEAITAKVEQIREMKRRK